MRHALSDPGDQSAPAPAPPRARCGRARAWSATISTWATGAGTQRRRIGTANVYLWIVPARVAGNWTLTQNGRSVPLVLEQLYQQVTGTAGEARIEQGRLTGADIRFITNLGDGRRTFEGRVDGDTITPADPNAGWRAGRASRLPAAPPTDCWRASASLLSSLKPFASASATTVVEVAQPPVRDRAPAGFRRTPRCSARSRPRPGGRRRRDRAARLRRAAAPRRASARRSPPRG